MSKKTPPAVQAPALTDVETATIAHRAAAVRPKMTIAFKDADENHKLVMTISVDVARADKESAWRLLEASLGTSDHEFAALMMAGVIRISTQGKRAESDTKAVNGYLG